MQFIFLLHTVLGDDELDWKMKTSIVKNAAWNLVNYMMNLLKVGKVDLFVFEMRSLVYTILINVRFTINVYRCIVNQLIVITGINLMC